MAFRKKVKGSTMSDIEDMLKEFGIPEDIIKCARKQTEDAG